MSKKLSKFLKIWLVITFVIITGNLSLVPAPAMAVTAGDLIKSPGSTAVYYLGADNKKYVFPDEKVFYSWYPDFSLVTTVTLETLQSYQTVGNVKMRAGTKLIQFVAINPDGTMNVDDPHVYALEPNGVRRWIETADVALALYGDDWETKIYGCPNTLIDNYDLGDSLSTAIYPVGSVVEDSTNTTYYFNDQNQIQEITSEGFADNMFQNQYTQEYPNCLTCLYSLGTMINSLLPDLVSVVQNAPANMPDNAYYVSTAGNDNNSGSLEYPFRTITKAAEIAQAGDIVYIRGGTYDETVIPQNSGSVGNYITFTNYPGENVNLRATDGYGFYLDLVNYIKISGLTISRALGGGVQTIDEYQPYKEEGLAHGAGVKMFGANNNIITNNVFYDNDIGIFVSEGGPNIDNTWPAVDNQIIDNTIYHSGEAGIRVKRSDGTLIDNNVIYENGLKVNNVFSELTSGIFYYCTEGITISNNTIYGNSENAINNYAGTNDETCDATYVLIENNILAQTYAGTQLGTINYGQTTVLVINDQEAQDPTHIYRNNTFYNGSLGEPIVVWGVNNVGQVGEVVTVNEFNDLANALNSQSGVGNVETTTYPIQ